MDLLQLRYFQAVARHQHVSRAAAELGVAQPSLSRTVARLETDLGVPLFDRQGRGVRLNRFGAAFARRVDAALAQLDDGRRELADAAELSQGSVTVAAETLRPLTGLLARYLAQYPGVRLSLHQSAAPDMPARLLTGETDLCLASQPLAGPGLRTAELRTEEVLLAVPPGHRLAGRRRVRIPDLAAEPVVTTRPGYWPRVLTDRLFADAGLRPAIACEGDELGTIRGLISAGLGVGLLPATARSTTDHPPVGWLAVDHPGCRRTLALGWRGDRYLAAAARRLRDLIVADFRDQAPDVAGGHCGS
jgi:DNA-binding transcriptional LysR family regulator